MVKYNNILTIGLFIAALLLGGLGLVLRAAHGQAKDTQGREVLDLLVKNIQWPTQWVEEVQAYRIAFRGPDVFVRVSNDFIIVQSYLGRIARDVSANDLMRVLRRNYDLYQGKFGLDSDMDLWFEIVTASRLLDAEELDRQIAFCADAAADASDLIKTTPPAVKP